MQAVKDLGLRMIPPAQAAELSRLVELEARWENMRKIPSWLEERAHVTRLLEVQKAYETFHSKLVAYNKQYVPAHVRELLLNTPSRLARWCRAMGELYGAVEHAPQEVCPAHVVEKAYRAAERISARMNKGRVSRSAPLGTIRAAIEDLEALVRWCDELATVAPNM
jgi:hypothetical protein